jgi:ADP-ribose pyrophosphatase
VSETVYKGRHVDVVLAAGKEIVLHGHAVAVVAVDAEDRVVLVRQERVGANAKLLEIPAGNIEDGETPLDTAQRELREETGLHGGDWVELAAFYTTPGFCDERMHVFLARNLGEGEAQPEGSEELEIVRVPVRDIPSLLPELEDAKTLAGLLLQLRLEG